MFHRVEVDHCYTFYLFYKSNCSEAKPQLHQSRRRTRWCSLGWRWTTILLIIYFMNLTAQKRSRNCTREEKDALVFHRVELDNCYTYYLLYEFNCSEAEPQLHQSRRRARWCSTGWRWTIFILIIYFMNLTAQKRSHNCNRA